MLGREVLRRDPSRDWLSCVSWRSKGSQRMVVDRPRGVEHPRVESGRRGQDIRRLAAAGVLCLSESLRSALMRRRRHSTCVLHSKTQLIATK